MICDSERSYDYQKTQTIYLADSMHTCEGMYVYRAYYEGRAYTIDSKYVTDIQDVKTRSSWIYSPAYRDKNLNVDPSKVKVEKRTVAGDVFDSCHYYYIYAKPSTEPQYVVGAICAGMSVDVVKEKYNSKWAMVKSSMENSTIYGYMKRADLNTMDSI
ncbi:MAG: hypothetical protein PUK75_02430 [bacterium]|nr:hypothetical protein [bacterium]